MTLPTASTKLAPRPGLVVLEGILERLQLVSSWRRIQLATTRRLMQSQHLETLDPMVEALDGLFTRQY